MNFKTVVRLSAGVSLFSMALYAFTGLHFWSQLQGGGDVLRALLLLLIHIIPVIVLIAMET